MTREVVNLNKSRERLPEISSFGAPRIMKPINQMKIDAYDRMQAQRPQTDIY
jgi:hypothetical protein